MLLSAVLAFSVDIVDLNLSEVHSFGVSRCAL